MKILIVQTSFLGDTILSTPVIKGIKEIYPSAEIWMMTTPASAQLVERDPFLSGVIKFDKRGKHSGINGLLRMKQILKSHAFDKVYSLHRSIRTSILLWWCGIPERIGFKTAGLNFLYHHIKIRNPNDHDVIRNLAILSDELPSDPRKAELRLFAPAKESLRPGIRRMLPPPHEYILLVPGSVWPTKRWHWQGYRDVAQHFLKKGRPVVLLGAASDRPIHQKVADGIEVIDLAGKTNIAEAMYVVKHANIVFCNDSMALHLASAFKVPNLAIFCATSPEFGFSPWRNNAVVVEKEDLDCKPCRRHGSKRCPQGTEACMRELSSEEVLLAAEKLLSTTV
jgi:heptosyltransferase-2